MHTLQVLAFLCFVVAAVMAGYVKSWPLLLLAAGLALDVAYPVFNI